jgi:hypothetical protein
MGREIKFKAWNPTLKLMFTDRGNNKDYVFGAMQGKNVGMPLQYTGLKDKDGKEIYEGDIVELKEYGSFRQRKVVFFAGGGFVMNKAGNPTQPGVSILGYKLEVVGNVYENPEFLEK